MSRKPEDADRLSPGKENSATRREIDRKDNPIFRMVDYIKMALM